MRNRRTTVFGLPLLFALGAATSSASATEFASFEVHHLNPNDAVSLLGVRVPEARICNMAPVTFSNPGTANAQGVIQVSCNADGLVPRIEAALATIDVLPPTQRFHVVVLTASRKDGAVPSLPASETKALNDFAKVMTYRSYRVDAEAAVQSDEKARALLSGVYSLEMETNLPGSGDDAIHVRHFQLAATGPSPSTFIDTSFSIRKGETLVLGSSVDDQTARVILVTALP